MKIETTCPTDYPYRELAAMAKSGTMVRHHFVRIDDSAAWDDWLTRHARDNVFASLGRFRQPDPNSLALCDECVFDLDSDDLEHARQDTLKLFDLLWKHLGIHPNNIDLAFSGAKGFHVRIPPVVFGHPVEPHLLAVWKSLARRLFKEGICSLDTGIYQTTRLFRWINTINTKSGLYKTALDFKELRDYDVAFILETARTPRQWTSMATPEECPRAAGWLRHTALPWVQQHGLRTAATVKPIDKGWWYPHCLRAIEQSHQKLADGTRHETYKILSRFYVRIGMSGSEAQERLCAIDRRNPIRDPDYIDRIVAFGQRAPGFPSCRKDLLKEWCNPKQCFRGQRSEEKEIPR